LASRVIIRNLSNQKLEQQINSFTASCFVVVCTNPDEYLFWDTIHLTTAAHQLIGELAFNTLQSTSSTNVPEANSILGILVFSALATKEVLTGGRKQGKG